MTQINNDSDLYNIHNLCIDSKSRELFLHSSFDSEEESGVEFRAAIMFEKNVDKKFQLPPWKKRIKC